MNTTELTEKQKYWLKHLEAIEKFDGTLEQDAEARTWFCKSFIAWKVSYA